MVSEYNIFCNAIYLSTFIFKQNETKVLNILQIHCLTQLGKGKLVDIFWAKLNLFMKLGNFHSTRIP